ncbi:class I SAM-dependent methyltransferase [Desulfospira joergensenii]|uniref:class I SAM-dependent methyltransferase n=1 Tax=Desulfospira joergensenii TaxID=53329 RepID=UPI0003B42A43|nr:class I SAM-dependent methyltransferase [Desulfospira joergensenii]
MTETNWTRTRTLVFDRDNAQTMNRIAKTVFRPIYPVIAGNAMSITGISRGRCLDLGTGPAMLAMAVAQAAPGMTVTAFDFSGDSGEIAEENIRRAGLGEQVVTAFGDVHKMPFEDGRFDLIVSRGSMFFWKDLKSAFSEVLRVLAPGGATYIGGGFGSLDLKNQVIKGMAKVDPAWDCYAKKKTGDDGHSKFEQMFAQLGCQDRYRIIDDDTGFWIILSKD